MIYGLSADLVLIVHLGFVLFVVLGGLLVWRWRWLIGIHLAAVFWGALIEFAGFVCPLTPLEGHLRELGGEMDEFADEGLQRLLGAQVVAIGEILPDGVDVLRNGGFRHRDRWLATHPSADAVS